MDTLSGLSLFATVWLGLWVIPSAIMNPETRRIENAVNHRTMLYFLLLLVMHTAVVMPEAGLSAMSVIRVLVLSLLPFGSAYMMVRYYHSTVR